MNNANLPAFPCPSSVHGQSHEGIIKTEIIEIIINSPKYGDKIVFIDNIDAELIAGYTWSVAKSGTTDLFYAVAWTKSKKGKRQQIKMHRLIMAAQNNQIVDHRDRNSLNNSRSNLRFASTAQNTTNSKLSKTNTSGYKGIRENRKGSNKFRVQIIVGGKTISGGKIFKTAEEAALRYNELAIKYFGEFARLNDIS